MSNRFSVWIDDYTLIHRGYTLWINDKIVKDTIPSMEEVVKEIKKYLRLRFKESIK